MLYLFHDTCESLSTHEVRQHAHPAGSIITLLAIYPSVLSASTNMQSHGQTATGARLYRTHTRKHTLQIKKGSTVVHVCTFTLPAEVRYYICAIMMCKKLNVLMLHKYYSLGDASYLNGRSRSMEEYQF